MEQLPLAIENIILNHKYHMEHCDKLDKCLKEMLNKNIFCNLCRKLFFTRIYWCSKEKAWYHCREFEPKRQWLIGGYCTDCFFLRREQRKCLWCKKRGFNLKNVKMF
jgi:hypothetical protein